MILSLTKTQQKGARQKTMTTNFLEFGSVSFPLWMFIVFIILAVLFGAVARFYYGFYLASKNPHYFDDDAPDTPANQE